MKKVKFSVLLFVIMLLVPISLLVPTTYVHVYAGIPSYVAITKPLPTTNIGPTAPLIVKPGSCFNIVLKGDLNISYGYIWRVAESAEKLVVVNYTVAVNKSNSTNFEICIPQNVIEGLYDLELAGSSRHSIPRSLWILGETPKKVRVVIMSDLHFGAGPGTLLEGDICRFSAALLASSLNPTLVLWAGDITDGASESQTIQAQVYRYLLLYKYPVLSVPGNHDYPSSWYTEYLGPVRWTRVLGDRLLIVGIFTNPYKESGVVAWEEVSFLEEALQNYSHVPLKILVFHYPMFYYQGEVVASYDDEEVLKPYAPGVETPVSSYWSVNMTAFRYVLKLIEDYNVTVVVSGHIHRDQFVKYISTRTNTTTYFITVTASGMSAERYQGISVFELDLETGEISFPITPPTFTGFNYSPSRLSLNSLPVKSLYTEIVKSSLFYRLSAKNNALWLDVNSALILVLPWSKDLPLKIEVLVSSPESSVKTLDHIIVENTLFLSVKLTLKPGAGGELLIAGADDVSPPMITLKRHIPETPPINKTFTMYIEITDVEWGVDISNLVVKFNGTSMSVEYSPETLMADFNTVTLTLTLTMKSREKTLTVLEVYVKDYCGHEALKKYGIIFYPSGVKPSETPVWEIVEVTETPTAITEIPTETAPLTTITPTAITSTTVLVTTPTITLTQTATQATTLTAVLTPTTTTQPQTESPLLRKISISPEVVIILVIVAVLVVALVAIFVISKKRS